MQATVDRAADEGARADRLSIGALAFVILALIALALIPALMLDRVSRANDDLARTTLPAYNALNEFMVAMEQRVVANRSSLMTGESYYDAQYEAAVRRETRALGAVRELGPSLGPAFERDLAALLRLVEVRDSVVQSVSARPGSTLADALPRFDALHDSLLLGASRLQRDLRVHASARMADEGRWIARQQLVALVLSLITLVAALAVGRFAIMQRRLRRRVQRALLEAERLRNEAELGRRELERVTESRTRLLRGFTHDVKNPLGAARGYLDLLIDGIQGPLSDEQLRSIERARASLDSGLRLVEELLELARAESGHLEIVVAPCDLGALTLDAVEEARPLAESKGLSIQAEVDGAPTVATDERRVRQVVGNLVSNAIKYTPAGSVVLRVLSPARADDKARVGIAVIDTGTGIPLEKQKLLFHEFVRLDPGGTGGVGVGLTISDRIARALGGEIALESTPDRGSTFTLWLPLQPPAP